MNIGSIWISREMSFLSQLHFMTPKKNLTSLQITVSPPTSRNTNDHNLYTNSLVLRLESHSRLASMWLLHRSGSLQEQQTEDPGKWLRERTLQIGSREGRGQFVLIRRSATTRSTGVPVNKSVEAILISRADWLGGARPSV